MNTSKEWNIILKDGKQILRRQQPQSLHNKWKVYEVNLMIIKS